MSHNESSPAVLPADVDALVGSWLTLPEVAERLDVVVTRVHNLIQDRAVIAVRRGERGIRSIPAAFLEEDRLVSAVKGTLILLHDAGYDDVESLRWLFTDDESLPGSPIDALRGGRKTEVRRRAQALAW
ncbi:MAG: Rv2175c family DNA-binding protein [Micrococcus sp.]|nr:Rv2175c family DNA-binding protein [Micrococcus sp.]